MPLLTWAAKRTIIARLQAVQALAESGDPLADAQIVYALPDEPDRVCVYGGRARSTRRQVSAERNALHEEIVVVEVRVRVFEPGDDQQSTEAVAEAVAQRVSQVVAGIEAMGTVGVTATDQDPTVVSPDPDPYVVVNLVLSVTLALTSGAS